jgi:hypothetical protein
LEGGELSGVRNRRIAQQLHLGQGGRILKTVESGRPRTDVNA